MSETMRPPRVPKATDAWKLRMQRFNACSLTVRDFCETEGVSPPSFYQWQRRLKSLEPELVPGRRPRRKSIKRASNDNALSSQAVADSTNSRQTVRSPQSTNRAKLSTTNGTTSTAIIPAPSAPPRVRSESSAFHPVQLSAANRSPLATIQLPSGVVVELQNDAAMISTVLERFLPIALTSGGGSC